MDAIAEANLVPVAQYQAEKLAAYGNLLMKWNARTNLTSITEVEGVLQRHIVESVAAAQLMPADAQTLLDYGTGAGLPGIPIAICRPNVAVTLAESQAKKVAFLRESVRTLALSSEIFAGRVAALSSHRRFGSVTMRAVDKMEQALPEGVARVACGGLLILFVTGDSETRLMPGILAQKGVCGTIQRHALPTFGELLMIRVEDVPRGTTAG